MLRTGAILIVLSAVVATIDAYSKPANVTAAPASLLVEDLFGRVVNTHGLTLVDWEGYMANPAIKFFLTPPAGAAFPAKAVLTAKEPRLCFDLPSQAGAGGPRKEITFANGGKVPVHIAIAPNRNGHDEDHILTIAFTDARGKRESLDVPLHVINQHRERPEEFTITVDFSQDRTGFFDDEKKRATVVQAARDWVYYFADMRLAPVAAGTEKTMIWSPDGFKSTHIVTNAKDYTGYLLYAYGIKSGELRSGGEPSPYGGFQVSAGKQLPIRRSGGLEVEIQGNYNTKGWRVTLGDDAWWQATNLGDVENDLYSIAHHEIGHALIFNPNNQVVKRGQLLESAAIRAYLGRGPTISKSDHLEGVVDPASLHGAFGNEYHGKMPLGRWLITKLDLLCAQAVGYELRETSAFRSIALVTESVPDAKVGAAYSSKLRAEGGIPFYAWDVVGGALPDGLSLDSFTGELRGTPTRAGNAGFTVRVRDYHENGTGMTRQFRLRIVEK